MRYKMCICPNCKYKTVNPPSIQKSGRYICPKCSSGMKIQPMPGFTNNQRHEVNPLERIRRQLRVIDDDGHEIKKQ